MANYSSAIRVVLLKVQKEFLNGAKNAAIALRS
jgi:hypothetical protein